MTQSFAGTWTLDRWSALKNGAQDGYPMGEDALGQIIYADDGHMCAFLMRADFAAKDAPATADTCLSYAGTWQFDGDRITHQVQFSSLPHWVGRPLVRDVTRHGGDLILRTAPETSKSGNRYEHELVWRRVS
jgi:hypothetical protein